MTPFNRAHTTSYQRFIATIGLPLTVFKIDGDFSRKSPNFPTPLYFAPPLKGSAWNWVSALGSKTRMMGLPGQQKSLTIYSAVWIQSTNVTDGQTDGRTEAEASHSTHLILKIQLHCTYSQPTNTKINYRRLIAPVATITYIILSSNKIQNGNNLVPTYVGCAGKWPLNECRSVVINN